MFTLTSITPILSEILAVPTLGLRGVASANEWNTRYRFAREIEKLVKAQEDQTPILSQSGAPCA